MFQEKTGGQDVRDAMAGSGLVWGTARHAKDASRPLARERAQSPLHRSGRARDWDRGSRRVHHVIARLLDCLCSDPLTGLKSSRTFTVLQRVNSAVRTVSGYVHDHPNCGQRCLWRRHATTSVNQCAQL